MKDFFLSLGATAIIVPMILIYVYKHEQIIETIEEKIYKIFKK